MGSASPPQQLPCEPPQSPFRGCIENASYRTNNRPGVVGRHSKHSSVQVPAENTKTHDIEHHAKPARASA